MSGEPITLNRLSTRVRNLLPVTWDAMSQAAMVDSSVLLDPIEFATAMYLGEDKPSEETINGLNRLVLEFLSKFAALELIGPGIDYWMAQKLSITTTGTSETTSFPERVRALEKRREELIADLAKLEPIVAPLIPAIAARKGASAPRMSSLGDELLTPNPQDFGRMYAEKTSA